MRVLVTGVSGHVGIAVVRDLLEHGHEIVAFDKAPPRPEIREKCTLIYADITDRLAVLRAAQGCEAIVHLGSLANPHHGNNETLTHVNVCGTQYILAAAEANSIERVVLASSCCVFGLPFARHPIDPQYLPMNDDHPRLPQDLYGLSKVCNEETAAAYTRLCGMTTICLRLTGVRRFSNDLPPWFARMLEYTKYHKNCDLWTYVDERDTARAFRLSIEADVSGHHRLIIAARDSLTPYDIRDLAREHYPALAESVAHFKPHQSLYDTSRAEDVLGFVAQHSWRELPALQKIADEILAAQK